MSGTDHADEARRILADGESAISKLRSAQHRGEASSADDYGKKAMGCWAQAQVHATLALAEQQRIANILSLARIESENSSTPTDALDYLYDREVFDLGGKLVTNPSIMKGLGLP